MRFPASSWSNRPPAAGPRSPAPASPTPRRCSAWTASTWPSCPSGPSTRSMTPRPSISSFAVGSRPYLVTLAAATRSPFDPDLAGRPSRRRPRRRTDGRGRTGPGTVPDRAGRHRRPGGAVPGPGRSVCRPACGQGRFRLDRGPGGGRARRVPPARGRHPAQPAALGPGRAQATRTQPAPGRGRGQRRRQPAWCCATRTSCCVVPVRPATPAEDGDDKVTVDLSRVRLTRGPAGRVGPDAGRDRPADARSLLGRRTWPGSTGTPRSTGTAR